MTARVSALSAFGLHLALSATGAAAANQLWSFEPAPRANLFSSPAVAADGTVYVATAGALYAITNGSGSASNKWVFPMGSGEPWQCSTPALGVDGTIYVANGGDGNLYAVNPDGSKRWSYHAGAGPGSAAIGWDNTIFYATFNSRVYAIAGTNKPAGAPWPMFRQNARHTGKIEKPSLGPPQKRADANFDVQLFGQLGGTFTIEGSTNLNTWTSLTSFVATTVPMGVADLGATNSPFKFYRAVESP